MGGSQEPPFFVVVFAYFSRTTVIENVKRYSPIFQNYYRKQYFSLFNKCKRNKFLLIQYNFSVYQKPVFSAGVAAQFLEILSMFKSFNPKNYRT